MKKRILSLVLTLTLLLTLIPLGGITANAASAFTVSSDCLELIKEWEGFREKPYWDYSQWTVGYGTRVPDGKLNEYQSKGISREEAEKLLSDMLADMGKTLNSFADKFGLSLTQAQFDALLSLSFNCGPNWVYQTSTLRTAVVEGWTGDDFLFAFGQWSNAGGTTMPALVRRRLAEANIYLNGIYDTAVPENYCYVRFDANGGESEITVQAYDADATPEIRAVPTYEGYNFEGWYTDPTGGELVTVLDAGVRNYTLYAHWSAGDGEGHPQDPTGQEITGTSVNYQKQIATGVLNSFSQPIKGALVVDAYHLDEVVDIVAEYTDNSGTKWGKVSNGGWINLTYTQEPVENDSGIRVKVTVTATDVNVRRGPGTSYACVGKADKGDVLVITDVSTGGGYTWGKFSTGWIALKYTNYDSVANNGGTEEKPEADNNTNNGTATVIATGKVTLSSGVLNVRSGAGTGNPVVSSLRNGTAVEILEKKTVGSTVWGRISNGWISLDYVKLDGEEDSDSPDSGNDTPDAGTDNDSAAGDNAGAGDNNGSNDNTGSNDSTESGDTDTGNSGTGTTIPPEQDSGNDTNSGTTPEKVKGKVVLSSGRLNVRSGPGTTYSVVGSLAAGTAVEITERKQVGTAVWGKISNGWICMDYVRLDTDIPAETETVSGVVSASGSQLRVRTGPGMSYGIAAYLNDGAAVQILERKTVNGTVWGRISTGWISMNYVKLTTETPKPSTPENDSGSAEQPKTGVITLTSGWLNVRSGAGTNHSVVGSLGNGARVTILETKTVNGTTWGRISNGWISMDYVK